MKSINVKLYTGDNKLLQTEETVPSEIIDLTDGSRVATNEQNIATLQGQVNTHNGEIANLSNEVANKASVQYVDQKFNGASKAIAYDSYSTMITAFNALGDDVYAIGQDVLIQTLQVPDLWVSGIESASVQYTYVDDATFTSELDTNGYVQVGYYKLSALETQKVDLTDYQKKLTAGTGITIDANNVISASGGSSLYLHNVFIPDAGTIQVYSSSSTKFKHWYDLGAWLSNNGFTDISHLYPVITKPRKDYSNTPNKNIDIYAVRVDSTYPYSPQFHFVITALTTDGSTVTSTLSNSNGGLGISGSQSVTDTVIQLL